MTNDKTTALKNADDMMQEIVKMVDMNRDGKIQYEGMVATLVWCQSDFPTGVFRASADTINTAEFRTFVEAAERQLLLLFRSIDRDHDGKVGRDELGAAFQKAGLAVPKRRVLGFFDEIDMNHDGFISFDEWR